MRKYRVLIYPAGTEIAFEIHNALKYSKFVELYGTNSIQSHAEFVFKNMVESIPFVDDINFIDSLNSIIDKYNINYVYPAHDSACFTLTKEAANIHATIVTSPMKTVEICRSKNKTYDFFYGMDYLPRTYKSIAEIKQYPVFIKPSVGQGSVGAQKVNTEKELLEIISSGIEYSICEYLAGEEYTIDCFTDRNGKLRVCHQRTRERIRAGIAVRSRIIETDEEIWDIARDINSKLVFNGAWFFQVKKNNDGKYRLMEIAARIPGTMATSRNLGINYPLLTLYNMWGYDVDIIENNTEILLDRAFISRFETNVKYSKVYMDFDDTLYIDGKVNLSMIWFLYQCSNKKKPVVLLTKHDYDIHQSLKHYKIPESLFEKIIRVPRETEKYQYINEEDAIFIDDSFAERKKVFEEKHIRVYDLDMIESLIDWRM